MELARHIREHRTRLGLSQEALAEAVYVSRQTISNWETDRTYPDVQSLLLLSGLFGTTVDELVKGDVEAMEETCRKDRILMERLSIGMAVLALLGVIAVCAGFWEADQGWGWHCVPTFILAGVLYGTALALALWCERVKKAHNLVTYRQIVAFSKGESPEHPDPKDAAGRGERVFSNMLKMLAGACAGAAAAFLVWNLFGLIWPG